MNEAYLFISFLRMKTIKEMKGNIRKRRISGKNKREAIK